MIKQFGKIIDVKTELYYEDETDSALLKMVLDYENGKMEIPEIRLDGVKLVKNYSNKVYSSDYILPKDVISCNLTMPLGISTGKYATLKYKYPEVNKVYNINDNLIIGVYQSRNKDKTCLCFSKFEDGKFIVERFEYIEKQQDMDKYIEENKNKWI